MLGTALNWKAPQLLLLRAQVRAVVERQGLGVAEAALCGVSRVTDVIAVWGGAGWTCTCYW